MSKTKIEWSEVTWNPTSGCDRTSPGCDNCYALSLAKRLKAMGSAKYQNDGDPATSGPGFKLTLHPDVLDEPLRWKKPRTVFVNSMSDLFHPDVPAEFIGSVWDRMASTPRHTYQVLTKRSQRMHRILSAIADGVRLWRGSDLCGPLKGPLANVWVGASVESQRYADLRIPHLLATPAAVRFLSIEPLLGPVDLSPWLTLPRCGFCRGSGLLPGKNFVAQGSVTPTCWHCGGSGEGDGTIDWCIVGGESGPNARFVNPTWVTDLRDQCEAAGVPFFFKQWGGRTPKAGGRLLDGVTHDAMPDRPRGLR
jgi:protein gp37